MIVHNTNPPPPKQAVRTKSPPFPCSVLDLERFFYIPTSSLCDIENDVLWVGMTFQTFLKFRLWQHTTLKLENSFEFGIKHTFQALNLV